MFLLPLQQFHHISHSLVHRSDLLFTAQQYSCSIVCISLVRVKKDDGLYLDSACSSDIISRNNSQLPYWNSIQCWRAEYITRSLVFYGGRHVEFETQLGDADARPWMIVVFTYGVVSISMEKICIFCVDHIQSCLSHDSLVLFSLPNQLFSGWFQQPKWHRVN